MYGRDYRFTLVAFDIKFMKPRLCRCVLRDVLFLTPKMESCVERAINHNTIDGFLFDDSEEHRARRCRSFKKRQSDCVNRLGDIKTYVKGKQVFCVIFKPRNTHESTYPEKEV